METIFDIAKKCEGKKFVVRREGWKPESSVTVESLLLRKKGSLAFGRFSGERGVMKDIGHAACYWWTLVEVLDEPIVMLGGKSKVSWETLR